MRSREVSNFVGSVVEIRIRSMIFEVVVGVVRVAPAPSGWLSTGSRPGNDRRRQ
jgi:hypothetical protein